MLKNEVLEHLEVRLAAKEHPPITEGLPLRRNVILKSNITAGMPYENQDLAQNIQTYLCYFKRLYKRIKVTE